MLDNLKRLFKARRSADDGSPIPAFWVTDGEEATLISPESGRVHAYVCHDGYGKYSPTLIVSPWRALRLVHGNAAALVSLLSFPRFTVEVIRQKSDSLEAVQEQIECTLGLRD